MLTLTKKYMLSLVILFFTSASAMEQSSLSRQQYGNNSENKGKPERYAPFENQPDDTIYCVMETLPCEDLVNFAQTSKRHHEIYHKRLLKKRIPTFSDSELVNFSKISKNYKELASDEQKSVSDEIQKKNAKTTGRI